MRVPEVLVDTDVVCGKLAVTVIVALPLTLHEVVAESVRDRDIEMLLVVLMEIRVNKVVVALGD